MHTLYDGGDSKSRSTAKENEKITRKKEIFPSSVSKYQQK